MRGRRPEVARDGQPCVCSSLWTSFACMLSSWMRVGMSSLLYEYVCSMSRVRSRPVGVARRRGALRGRVMCALAVAT